MTPVLVGSDDKLLGKLRALRESRVFFQEKLKELQKKGTHFLVLHRDAVVGEGPTPEEAWARAKESRAPLEECLLIHVPKKGESYFF